MPEFTRPYMYEKQFRALFNDKRWALCEASTKSGKAQPLNATIWTPHGPTTMGSIKIGDYVIGIDGRPKEVAGIYPQGERQLYHICFSDGVIVEADGEHLWEVHEFNNTPKVLTTLDLLHWPKARRERAWVPNIEPVEFVAQDVPLDPYLVGLLIGDGGMTTEIVRFSSIDEELLEYVRELLPEGHELVSEGNRNSHDFRVTARNGAAQLREDGKHIKGILTKLGLCVGSSEKRIPRCYLYNDISIRRAVLQGILDTDGFVDNRGQPHIEQTSLGLSVDIETLVQSLGGTVTNTFKEHGSYVNKTTGKRIYGKAVFRQNIRFKDASWCFRLKRKRDLVTSKLKSGNRMFRDISPSRIAEAQCIEIVGNRHLYLTDGFVPTHNTVGCIAWLLEQAFKGRHGMNYWWVAPVADQARIAYSRIKNGLTKGSFSCLESPTPRITLLNGAIIWFKSADNPDSLYGEDVYAAVMDEASRQKADAWYAVRSTLTATGGPARIIGNVKGRKNWFYEMARRIEKGDEPNGHFERITVVDAIEAGIIPKEEVEDARRNLPELVFRELYMAEPADDGGNPFGLNHIAACVSNGLATGPVVAYGIDLAKKQDYFVVIGLNDHGQVASFHRWRNVPWRDSIRRVWDIVGEDAPALVDSTGVGDPVLEELQHEHGNFRGYLFSSASKQRLMEGLAVSIQGHEISFPGNEIRAELETFEYEITRTGVRYTAPEGYHDDCVCSLALARAMWVETANSENIIAYYDQLSAKQRELSNKPPSNENRPWRPEVEITAKDVLDNELSELYNTTLAKYSEPKRNLCQGCGEPVLGPHRVSDGEFIWHPGHERIVKVA